MVYYMFRTTTHLHSVDAIGLSTTVFFEGEIRMDTLIQIGTIAVGVAAGILIKEGVEYLVQNANEEKKADKKEKKAKKADAPEAAPEAA